MNKIILIVSIIIFSIVAFGFILGVVLEVRKIKKIKRAGGEG